MKRVGGVLTSLTLPLATCFIVLAPALASGKNAMAQGKVGAVEQHLKVFDVLDFDVFSNQKWDRLSESHSDDIVVTWPDGH